MKASLIVIGLCTLASASAFAECAFPKAPDTIPDGKTAAESEMINVMTQFKQYNLDVDAYLVCLDSETTAKVKDADSPGAILQLKAMQQKKRTSAVDERKAKVDTFNEQVRTFKARKS